MKKFTNLLYNKFTLGLLLTTLGSLLYAVLLKLSLEHLLDINIVRGGLTVTDLSYFFSIASWKIIFSTLLELVLGDKFHTPIGAYINNTDSTILKMDKDKSSTVNEGSSSGKPNKINENSSKELTYEEIDALQKKTSDNTKTQYQMVTKLRDLKSEKDLKFYDNNGALEIEVPNNMTEDESDKLSKQIGIIDRIYNSKRSEYKSLTKNDETLREAYKPVIKMIKETYKNLFDK